MSAISLLLRVHSISIRHPSSVPAPYSTMWQIPVRLHVHSLNTLYFDGHTIHSFHYPSRHRCQRGCCVQIRLSVCLSVCPCSRRKTAGVINTKLGTRIVYSSRCVAWHRSTGQRSTGQGHTVTTTVTVARDHDRYCVILRYLRPLPAWICMSIRLPMFSSLTGILFIARC